ncbi:hypothetical protein CL615_00180 [archaeon]|jgi:hypothetical protein|nr:hypothetical protein [archaeon]MDP6547403.1 hypothetical protein [Candidatus Woesearchaeota archaeon]|tara:strand:+ start:892 stop:2781 length:1890 start_codon:yes stop_codon:yes gene_type:complete
MKKSATIFLIFFFILISSASSLKTFEIEETEKISLVPKVEDADRDTLIYTFTDPLDGNGEWQTTYGDAGSYNSIITVSDGVTEVSEEILITVNKKEEKPTIDDFKPKEDSITIDEGNNLEFNIVASDLNNDKLTYGWEVNDKFVSNANEIIFGTNYEDAGEYKIKAAVSDGTSKVTKEWSINVANVDLTNILGQINDITVLETETARLELPDFKKYGLSYSISEPIGDFNEWKTDYDDSGEYTVTVAAEGKGFKGEKEVKVIVRNKDRPPKFVDLKDISIWENQEARIELKASDEDNNDVFFSAEDMPENAAFEGNVFVWKPSFDFVQKDKVFDYILDKFRIFRKSTIVVFTAQSNDLSDRKSVKITVKEVNRPFVLENIDDIEVDEGQQIIIKPAYNDPDNDRVSFSYSGFMDSNKKNVGFDDSGEYVVKITATDGVFTETRFVDVKVNDVNRKPVFDQIENAVVTEDNEIRIELKANDEDNDAIGFSTLNLPKNAKLKDNLFIWKPDFDFVEGTQKELTVFFTASDGTDEVTQKVKITVLNKNRPPKLVNASNNLIANKDKPVLFGINAVDEDSDILTYEWKFSFFDEFTGENNHQRIFTTTGTKKVEVKISDGFETISKVWNVEVV